MPKVVMPNMSGRTIDQGRIKLLSQIGKGSFGVVYNAVDMNTPIPELLAVKVLRKSTRNINSQYREIILHSAASSHENIVKFHRVLHDSQYFYIVLDFLPGGDMWGAIKAGEYWKNDDLVRQVFLKLIDGLQHCHKQGIYHRDMKPNNILVGEDASQVCISDFGLAAKAKKSQSFGVGTTQFRSPECNNFEGRYAFFDAERNDIWALGVIFACIIGGRMPWHSAADDDVDYLRHLRHPHYLRQVLPISKEANYILQRIFHPCTENAPSLDDVHEMVLRVKTFFMDDSEIKRSKRLTYISDQFEGMQRYMAALEANSDSLSVLPRRIEVNRRSGPINSQSLCALEEGKPLSRHGTPEARQFVVGMVLAGSPPRSSVLETPLIPAIVEHPPLSQPPLSILPETEGLQRNTSSTLITSKEESVRKGEPQKHHSWLKLSRSVRRLFIAEKVA